MQFLRRFPVRLRQMCSPGTIQKRGITSSSPRSGVFSTSSLSQGCLGRVPVAGFARMGFHRFFSASTGEAGDLKPKHLPGGLVGDDVAQLPMEQWPKSAVAEWLQQLRQDEELEFDVARLACSGKLFASMTEAHMEKFAGGLVGIDIFNAKEKKLADLKASPTGEKTWWGRRLRRAREPLTPEWVVALLTALGMAGSACYEFYAWYMGSVEFQAVEAVRHSKQEGPTNKYIPRVAETELASFMGKKQSKYLILAGPRGCGKTTVMKHAVQNKRCVLTVQVHDASHATKLFELILLAAGVDSEVAKSIRTAGAMKKLLAAAAQREKTQNPATAPDFVPSIVIEAGRGLKDNTIKSLARDAKDLMETGTASVAVVLSDASAAFALPEDPDRQHCVWLDDLSQEEANQLLDLHGCLVGDQKTKERNKLLDGMGTRPAALLAAADDLKRGKSVENIVNERKSDAKVAIHNMVSATPELPEAEDFCEIVKSLVVTSNHAVPTETLSRPRARNYKALCRAQLRDTAFHIVIYHPPSKSYRFYSRSHLLAALELDLES